MATRNLGAALVIGVVVVVAVFAVLQLRDDERTGTPSPSASAADESIASPSLPPTIPPSAPPGAIDITWQPVMGFDPSADVLGLEFVEGEWFALGRVAAGPDAFKAAIWTSPDGRSWTSATMDLLGGPDEYSYVTDVVMLGDDLVAIGSWGAAQSDQSAWVTWVSSDGGGTWSEWRDPPPGHFGSPSAIARTDAQLVAAGGDSGGIVPFDSFFATSDNGTAWDSAGEPVANAAVAALVATDRIVGVGTAWAVDAEGYAMAGRGTSWYSDDGGLTWVSTPVSNVDDTHVTDVDAFDGGLVAVGGSRSAALAWRTADGESWEAVDLVHDLALGARATALSPVAGGLLAVGNGLESNSSTAQGVTWISTDARSWFSGSTIGTYPEDVVRFQAVAANGSTVLAGGVCEDGACETVLWRGEVIAR